MSTPKILTRTQRLRPERYPVSGGVAAGVMSALVEQLNRPARRCYFPVIIWDGDDGSREVTDPYGRAVDASSASPHCRAALAAAQALADALVASARDAGAADDGDVPGDTSATVADASGCQRLVPPIGDVPDGDIPANPQLEL